MWMVDEAVELSINIKKDKTWPKSPAWLWRRIGEIIGYINRDGLRTVPSHAAERIRGIQRTTTFLCEAPPWDEVRAFHKGITSQAIECEPDWSEFECAPTTIWRD